MPKRPALVSAILLFIAVAVASCGGGGSGPAASVNGFDISVAEVQAMRLTSDAATIDKAQFATDLTEAIINVAIVEAARAEFSIEPTEAEIAARVADLTTRIEQGQGVTVAEFFGVQGRPVSLLEVIANQELIREQLYEGFVIQAIPATDDDANLLLSTDRLARTNACVSHILVASESEAVAARSRIGAGEAFETVAAQVGTDGTAADGGSLGCQQLGIYVGEFAQAAFDAPIGELAGPVETQFGFHLIRVDSRAEPTMDELKTEIDRGRVSQLIDEWVIGTIRSATVIVDQQYGTWVTDPDPQVQPPAT